jgi:enoyl-CoA hydratase/carnithine racemase
MSERIVLVEVADRIATVTLNDPDRRNPVTGNEMIAGLLDAFDRVQRNP